MSGSSAAAPPRAVAIALDGEHTGWPEPELGGRALEPVTALDLATAATRPADGQRMAESRQQLIRGRGWRRSARRDHPRRPAQHDPRESLAVAAGCRSAASAAPGIQCTRSRQPHPRANEPRSGA